MDDGNNKFFPYHHILTFVAVDILGALFCIGIPP